MPKVPRAAAGQGQGPAPPKKAAHQLRPYRRPRNKQELRVSQLILQALSARKQRGGLSLASLRKALLANGYDVEKNQARVQLAIKSLVSNGSLVQTKTTGSFKLGEQQQQQPQPQPQQSKGAGTEAKAGAQLQPTGEAAGSTGEDKSAAKKPRKRRTEKKAKPRRPRK